MPFFVSQYRDPQYVFTIGDSKTGAQAWRTTLVNYLNQSPYSYLLNSDDFGVGGYTVADMVTKINADLGGVSDPIDICVINLGSNELGGAAPDETTWKNNYRTIIEALHGKQDNAKIYIAKPVRFVDTPPADLVAWISTLWGWIDDLISEYSYVYPGVDETSLEGGDNYVTNFVDYTHYTVAGNTAVANLWAAIL